MSSHLLISAPGLTLRPIHKFKLWTSALLLCSTFLPGCWRHRPAPEHAAILNAPEQGSFDDTLLHPGERRITHVLPLTQGQGYATHPTINLDGTQIAFEAIRDGLSCEQVFVMDADGRNTRLISQGVGKALNPAFSPTGTQVLYQTTHLSQNTCKKDEPQTLSELSIYPNAHDLFLAHLGSSAARAIVDAPEFQGLASFSPRGDRVIYTQREDDTTALYIVDLSGDEPKTERINLAIHTPGEARFDTQGQRLVLTGTPNREQPFVRELFIWDFATHSLTQITEDQAQHGEPIFHPDGAHILFSSNIDATPDSPGRQIYMTQTDGAQLEQITFGPGMSTSPSLSARGSRFVFSSTRAMPGQPMMTPGIFIADFMMTPTPKPRLRGQAVIEADTMKSRIITLSSDAMQGREAGSPGELAARDWLRAQFEFVGLKPHPSLGTSYEQPFTFDRPTLSTDTVGSGEHGAIVKSVSKVPTQSANVVGWLPAREDGQPTELTLVIGAHYDHAGSGNPWLSTDSKDHGTLHPGADDNASGIAAMLELAEALATTSRRHDIIFVAFGAEEYGMHGSQHLVQSGLIDPARIITMINLDMVGRLEEAPLMLRGTYTSPVFRDLVRRHQPAAQIDVTLTTELPPSTDYAPFFAANIPILGLHTGLHEDYHSPHDVEALIDYDGLMRITTLTYLIARELTNSERQPVFQKAPKAHGILQPQPTSQPSRNYQSGPYFGSVPGRSPAGSPKGVYIRDVQDASPAKTAGLRAGDLLTHFDDTPIKDLPQFADVLMTYKPGDKVMVTFIREGKETKIEVVLAEPATR